jgi:hypothetical protein
MGFLACFTTLNPRGIVQPASTGTDTLDATSLLSIRNVSVLDHSGDRSSRGIDSRRIRPLLGISRT